MISILDSNCTSARKNSLFNLKKAQYSIKWAFFLILLNEYGQLYLNSH